MNINGGFADSVQRKLLQQIASGNESAFRQLYHNYYKRLLQFALIFIKIPLV